MAKYAVIDTSLKVVNVILANEGFTIVDHLLVENTSAKIGDTYDNINGVFIPAPVSQPTPEELRALMPDLSSRQIRLGLISIDVAEAEVDAALAGSPEGLIEWKHATSFRRLHPLIDQIGVVFSLTPEQIDTLWLWAADL
ncbi:hypothetical protein J1C56_02305 [Aminobacter anthyllidis]|uniref:Uncharacterized protein n=1 Tax=Aminobacter anthyllidis TaxID=1035067 RepID=A0A9X1A7N0_9HYPH|nr:hypothetical protein [Aminobacter anthyllidis]MBT1154417.1 hypothetical protein [Aminobacter anthyllidis]